MTVRYLKPKDTSWPQLSDEAIERVEAVLKEELDPKWVTTDEYSAYADMLFDHIIAQRQTVPGELSVH